MKDGEDEGRRRSIQQRDEQEEEESLDYNDSSEDELMCCELVRLVASKGTAEPLWTKEPEFAGMTRATCLFASRPKNK